MSSEVSPLSYIAPDVALKTLKDLHSTMHEHSHLGRALAVAIDAIETFMEIAREWHNE